MAISQCPEDFGWHPSQGDMVRVEMAKRLLEEFEKERFPLTQPAEGFVSNETQIDYAVVRSQSVYDGDDHGSLQIWV